MNVISIQSQVAFGHVGNSAAVFPMQLHGIDVIAVPTTLLSNRPGYQTIRGKVLEAQLVADLLLGIEERGAIDRANAILHAVRDAAREDVVLLAGKGHEATQEIMGKKRAFSDQDHARLALAARATHSRGGEQ